MPTHFAVRVGVGVVLLTGAMLSPALKTVMAQERQTLRPQIAVVDFNYADTRTPYSASYKDVGVAKEVSTRLLEALVAEETYGVIDPMRVQQALSTLNFSGPLSPTDAISLGKELKADLVLIGTITDFNSEQACTGKGQCSPATTAQISIESSTIDVDSGNVATRRSNVSMTREQSGNAPSASGSLGSELESEPSRDVLDDAVEKAISNLVKGLAGKPDFREFRRNRYP